MQDYSEENNITTFKWPPQSPDLNPIENLWAICKARRQKDFGFPASKTELKRQMQEIWKKIEPELLERLSNSAIKRLREVVKRKGKYIDY